MGTLFCGEYFLIISIYTGERIYVDRKSLGQDCAAAALFVACKIEDTLKKSREILAVSHSLKHGTGSTEAINPDSSVILSSQFSFSLFHLTLTLLTLILQAS